ncbi:M20 family metallopeptidase [Georgenia sp. AZ-5]|uniref:M20 metallopeptidase family protein n=1 Tax=Georgenia sp. AZ-5 TaxID=3367526 RepID=UPI003754E68B
MERLDHDVVASLIALRRDLHRHPELRFEEIRTASMVADYLQEFGLEAETVAVTGLVARLRASRPGPHVLLRADMDALPTPDLTAAEYASHKPGVAHACGHDVHTTVVAGVAEALARRPLQKGRVTFVFQPAEEIPFGETSGGAAVLETGVLDDVDVVLSLHCWPALPVGTIGVDQDVAMATKHAFKISVHGSGAHAATPSRGKDAVLAASSIVLGLNVLLGRETDSGARAALNVGTIAGGRSQSIVAPNAELTGTIRSVDQGVGLRLRDAVERVAAGTAAAVGVEAVVDWKNEMPAVRNDPGLVRRAIEVLAAHPVLALEVLDDPPMTADDFALYAERRPGLYLKLGVRSPDGTLGSRSLHDGRFDVDENALEAGVLGLVALIDDLLEHGWGDAP